MRYGRATVLLGHPVISVHRSNTRLKVYS